jgi:hypothetical protein
MTARAASLPLPRRLMVHDAPLYAGVYHRVAEHGTSPRVSGDRLVQESFIALQRGYINGRRINGIASHLNRKMEKDKARIW